MDNSEQIDYHKREIERYKKDIETSFFTRKEIIRFILAFIVVFAALFIFKAGKTFLFERDSINPNYVTYTECINAETDEGFAWRLNCSDYKSHTKLLASRIFEDATSSLLLPSLLTIIVVISAYSMKRDSQKKLEKHKADLIELYEKQSKK